MFPSLIPPFRDPARSGITAFNMKATPLFERVRWQGDFFRLSARLTRRSWRLLLLDDCLSLDMIRSPQSSVSQPVDLDKIKGTSNRSDDFDCRFHPVYDRLQTRWVRVASMMLQQTPLPPVELIRVQDRYFVVDGHHRISAARALHYTAVDAVLTAAYD